MRQARLLTKVRTSALLTFAVILAMGGTAFSRTLVAKRDVADFTEQQFPATQLLAQIAQARIEVDRAVSAAGAVAGQAPELREDLYSDVDLALTVLDEGVKSYEKMGQAAALHAQWIPVGEKLGAWRAANEKLVAALQARDKSPDAAPAALAAWKGARGASQAAEGALLGYMKAAAGEVEKVKARSTSATRSTLVVIGAMALLGILVAAAVAWTLERGVRRSLAALEAEAGRLEQAIGDGQLDVRADAGAAAPEFAPVVEGMNRIVEAFVVPLRLTASCIDGIARGDIPEKVQGDYRGEFGAITDNLNRCVDAVNALVEDTRALALAGAEGRLATRADASRHAGDFRKVVEGMNHLLDGLLSPLGVAAQAVADIARGQLPPEITSEFHGDLRALRDNVNGCSRAVQALVRDARTLVEAGVGGQLAVRADASQHQGDFRKIVEGMNGTLDAVVVPLTMAARAVAAISKGEVPEKITAEYQGDYRSLRDNLNQCFDVVTRLVNDVDGLAVAAVQGKLSVRADPSKHAGDFRRIVEGVNRTLDAVVAPIDEATRVLEQLGQRDLRARMTGDYQSDHARIKTGLNATAEALQDALLQVSRAAEQVSGASAQIASSSQSVATGASQQAASIEETTASIDTVLSITRRAVDNAQEANAVAQAAQGAATAGSAAVEQLQGAMGRIRQSADGTSQIIRDVSDIAFQTNLLALNAAVEAARAGEAGRGFAVVAEEVRSLALRAKEAANKTDALIRQSVKEAEAGELAAGGVAGKLTEIVQGFARVTGLVSEIAASSRDQSAGMDQISHSLGEMDKVTQQNAASAEESSAAASELNAQSEELSAMLSEFRLEQPAHGRALPDRAGPGRALAARPGRMPRGPSA